MKRDVARAIPRIGEYIPTKQPTYATFEDVMDAHKGRTFADIKYDGYRVQIHKSNSKSWVFTRNGNELNYDCYPEITSIVARLPVCIIDAELVGQGATHKEVFDNVKKRFRRDGISEKAVSRYLDSGIIDEVPLGLRVFDTLRFERKGLLWTPLESRRAYTERFDSKDVSPTETAVIDSVEALESLVNETFKAKQEGRVCKDPSSLYVPGSETIDWVKFKRSETLDLVVVGFYRNEAHSKELPFTSVLVAAYNKDNGSYETLGKVGVTRKGLASEIFPLVEGKMQSSPPASLVLSEKLGRDSYAKFLPGSYIGPESSVVLEVKAMNIDYSSNWQSCGLDSGKAFSMRIGFAEQLRPDKNPQQATTTAKIRRLYELQKRVGE